MINYLIICISYGLTLTYQLYKLVGRDYIFDGMYLSKECAYERIRYDKKLGHSEFAEYITSHAHMTTVRVSDKEVE